jgi:hypothetical protein
MVAAVMFPAQIRKRLITVIQLKGMPKDWERVAEAAITSVVPEVIKIIREEIEKAEKE